MAAKRGPKPKATKHPIPATSRSNTRSLITAVKSAPRASGIKLNNTRKVTNKKLKTVISSTVKSALSKSKAIICKNCKSSFKSAYLLKKHEASCKITKSKKVAPPKKILKTSVNVKPENQIIIAKKSKISTLNQQENGENILIHLSSNENHLEIKKRNQRTKETASEKPTSTTHLPKRGRPKAIASENAKSTALSGKRGRPKGVALVKPVSTSPFPKKGRAKEIVFGKPASTTLVAKRGRPKKDSVATVLKPPIRAKRSIVVEHNERAAKKKKIDKLDDENKTNACGSSSNNINNDVEMVKTTEGEILQSSMFQKVKSLLSNSKKADNLHIEKFKEKPVEISASSLRKNLAFSLEKNLLSGPIAKKSLPAPLNKEPENRKTKKVEEEFSSVEVILEKEVKIINNKEVIDISDNTEINVTSVDNVKQEKEIVEITELTVGEYSEPAPRSNTYSEVITVLEEPSMECVTAVPSEPEEVTVLPDPVEPEILTPLQPVKEEEDKKDFAYIYNPSEVMVCNDSQNSVLISDPGPSSVDPDDPPEGIKQGGKDGIAYSCAVCQKAFSRKYHLDRHLRISKCSGLPLPTFPCELCNRVYTRKDNLREHLRSHTGEVHRRKNHKCPHCDKAFHGQSLLAIHVRKHTGEKPFACDFCPKKFPSTGALSKHRMTHTGEKPYSCKDCGRKFTLKGTLSRHIRTHTGIRPHTCSFCGKKFIQVGGLNAHMFFHTGENGFKCEECGKVFNRKARLQMHQLYVHIKLKPFVCEECNKPFTRKEDLMRHSVLHTGEKPYKCPTCDRRFSVKPSLKLHLLTHTKEEPRSCHECGRAFIRKDCLLRHMRKRHRDVFDKLLFDEKDEKNMSLVTNRVLSESDLTENIRELLYLLIDEPTLLGFGWPDRPVDEVLELVIQRCGHTPVCRDDYVYMDRLRENAKLLFTVVIDDNAVKTLLNNQTVDEVILHVLRLAKT